MPESATLRHGMPPPTRRHIAPGSDRLMGPDRPITQLAVSRKPSSNPKVAPNEKTPGATGPPALSNFSKSNNFQRAGDRTRTGDVQLGKLNENKGFGASRAKSSLQTPRSLSYALTNWRHSAPLAPS